jgi:hypothetical protein
VHTVNVALDELKITAGEVDNKLKVISVGTCRDVSYGCLLLVQSAMSLGAQEIGHRRASSSEVVLSLAQ